jgi:hypothetical protein
MAATATTTEETKTTTTEQATQQATEKAPTRSYRPGFDIPPQKPMGVEDDPNYKMQVMLGKRGKKTEAKAGETEVREGDKGEKTTETTAKEGEKSETKPGSNLAELLAKNLKFRAPSETKTTEKAKEEVKTEVKDTKTTETTDKKTEEKGKTVVTKKKAEPTAADHARAAGEMAAAAASAAVTAAMPKFSTQQAKAETQESELPKDYKRDYEIAKHLAATNPVYKDAPQIILNEHRRSAEYASRWEQANPGKVFDPDAEEHNEFYASLERPWGDEEFVDARADMIAEQKISAKAAKLEEKHKSIEEREAKRELAGVAQNAVNTVAVLLAKGVDEAAHDIIVKQGFNKLEEGDPITAEALVDALNKLSPRIHTAVMVDDPEQRISFDANKNSDHNDWLHFLFEKEAQYAGQMDEKGRLFASRNEYVKLPPAQQARRWFLTADHLITEMTADAMTEVKERIQKERERGKKVAAALGYVPKVETNGGSGKDSNKSDATKTTEVKKEETTTTTGTKPTSPDGGGSAKIDTQGEGVKTKYDDLWSKTGKVLFGR